MFRENQDSIRTYGVREYTHPASKLVSRNLAERMAEQILSKYANGLSYVNANWKGDIGLELGQVFDSYDLQEKRRAMTDNRQPQITEYTCLSNEISFDGVLRFQTKARQMVKP